VAVVTVVAFVVAGCSRAVRVPETKLAPSTTWDGLYRVTTTTEQFTTRHFLLTDSTLVITKLGGSDKRYGAVDLPITIPMKEVRSVDRLETNGANTLLVVLGGLLVLGVILIGSANFSSLD
jgi:hypothetical protein